MYATQAAELKATFAPVRRGRPVLLQTLQGDTWTTVETLVQDPSGSATFDLGTSETGTVVLRALTGNFNGAAAKATPNRSMGVLPFVVSVSPWTHILTAGELSALTSYDESAGTVTFTNPPESMVLPAGTLFVIPPREGLPSGALREVVSSHEVGPTLSVVTKAADLPELFTRVPSDTGQIALAPTGVAEATDLAEGVTVEPPSGARTTSRTRGVQSLTGPELTLNINSKLSWALPEPNNDITAKVDAVGTISVAPTVTAELDTTWYGDVRGYRLGPGASWNNQIDLKFSLSKKIASGDTKKSLPLATVRRDYVGFIGPVPIYVAIHGRILLEYSLTGEAVVTYHVEQVGQSEIGVKNAGPGDLSPTLYADMPALTGDFTKVEAGGRATLFGGADLQVMLYGTAGPYAKFGAKGTATVTGTLGAGFTCELRVGPHGEAGLTTSEALKKLTGLSWGLKFWETDIPPAIHAKCPDEMIPSVPASAAGTNLLGGAESDMTPDGRYLVFTSQGYPDADADSGWIGPGVYRLDRQTGTALLISKAIAGGRSVAESPSISADGQTIAFVSPEKNMTAAEWADCDPENDPTGWDLCDGRWNVFVWTSGSIRRLTLPHLAGENERINGDSGDPEVSPDGRYVAFDSGATNMTTTNMDYSDPLFLASVGTGTIRLLTDGTEPSFTNNGNSMAYVQQDGSTGLSDVYVLDVGSGATRLVSGPPVWDGASQPTISGNGRYVAFTGTIDDPAQPGLGREGLILRDLTDNSLKFIPSQAQEPYLSGDGSFLVYSAVDRVSPDNWERFVYRYSLATNSIRTIAQSSAPDVDTDNRDHARVSDDGKIVSFTSANVAGLAPEYPTPEDWRSVNVFVWEQPPPVP